MTLHNVYNDPVVGCLYERSEKWRGLYKVLACPSDKHHMLLQQPGVWVHDNEKKPQESGWYVPRSLLDAGRLAARLQDYAPEPLDEMPLSGVKLYDHQARSVTFLRQVTPEREGCILGAEIGGGKTNAALHALWMDGYLDRPGLIVAPKQARDTWCSEGSDPRVNYGLGIQPLEGKEGFNPDILTKCKTFFIHFEILQAWQPWIFQLLRPSWLVVDELHWATNKSSNRSKALRNVALAGSIERRYGLTGTPITNERRDLWHQLAVVQPRQWGSNPHQFGVRYAGGTRDELGYWKFDELTNDLELRARMAGTLLLYTKKEVQASVPKLQRHVIEVEQADVEPDLWQTYCDARRDVVGYLQNLGKLEVQAQTIQIGSTTVKLSKNDAKPGNMELVCRTQLQNILGQLKVKPAIKAVDKIMRTHTHLVIFCSRVDTVKTLAKYFKAAYKKPPAGVEATQVFGPIHGRVTFEKRIEKAAAFAAAPRGIYISTIDAMQVSINHLKRADATLYTDLFWNAVRLTQSEGRAWRMGNPNEVVDSHFLYFRGTLDDEMLAKLKAKAAAESSMHEEVTAGVSLVRDLTPQGGEADGSDIDALCRALAKMEDSVAFDTAALDAEDGDWLCTHEWNDEGYCDLCGEVHPESAEGMTSLIEMEQDDEEYLAAFDTADNIP